MFTSSLLIGVVTTVLTWLAKLITMKMSNTRALREAELKALNARATVTKEAREYENKGFQYTRRFIAIATTLCVMVLPFVAVLWYQWLYPIDVIMGDMQPEVYFGYNVVDTGFWPFTSDTVRTEWEVFKGIFISPWHTDMFGWIMGMYFGDRLGNSKH